MTDPLAIPPFLRRKPADKTPPPTLSPEVAMSRRSRAMGKEMRKSAEKWRRVRAREAKRRRVASG